MSPLTAFESLLAYSPFARGAAAQAYDEETFRHFLTIERRRAEQSTRSFLMVLVSVRDEAAGDAAMAPGTSKALFDALGSCIREVDFLGWYREGRIVAAVLTQGAELPSTVVEPISNRVKATLADRLPARVSRLLNVRVVQLHGSARS